MLKFRTMAEDAERCTGPVWAQPGDVRSTAVGRVLRRFHLDELPQVVNVLRGEMSLVGPRPERPELATRIEHGCPEFARRLAVRPGITGLAQARARGGISPRNKLRYDLVYIGAMGPWLDIRPVRGVRLAGAAGAATAGPGLGARQPFATPASGRRRAAASPGCGRLKAAFTAGAGPEPRRARCAGRAWRRRPSISHRYRCIYVKQPKCAGTSVLDWFITHDGGRHSFRPYWYRGTLPERIQQVARMIDLYPGYCTFLRNPYLRLLLLYRHANRRAEIRAARIPDHPAGHGTLREFAELCAELLADTGNPWGAHAGAFFRGQAERRYGLRGIPLRHLEFVFNHARPQTSFLPDCNPERFLGLKRRCPGPLHFIGAVETIDTGFRQIPAALGLPRHNASGGTAPHHDGADPPAGRGTLRRRFRLHRLRRRERACCTALGRRRARPARLTGAAGGHRAAAAGCPCAHLPRDRPRAPPVLPSAPASPGLTSCRIRQVKVET